MKIVVRWFVTMALVFALNAQTNSLAPGTNAPTASVDSSNVVATVSTAASTNAPTHDVEIFADRLEGDSRARRAIYTGNVRVIDPRMKLTCEVMTVQSTNNFRQIDAERNVVIDGIDDDGKPFHATSGKAVYLYLVGNSVTNETVELTINPRVQQGSNTMVGEVILWDRQRDKFRVEKVGQHLVVPENFGATNKPPIRSGPTNRFR